jgi:hypothetical protein
MGVLTEIKGKLYRNKKRYYCSTARNGLLDHFIGNN